MWYIGEFFLYPMAYWLFFFYFLNRFWKWNRIWLPMLTHKSNMLRNRIWLPMNCWHTYTHTPLNYASSTCLLSLHNEERWLATLLFLFSSMWRIQWHHHSSDNERWHFFLLFIRCCQLSLSDKVIYSIIMVKMNVVNNILIQENVLSAAA